MLIGCMHRWISPPVATSVSRAGIWRNSMGKKRASSLWILGKLLAGGMQMMIFQQTRTILDWTISNVFNFFTSKNDGKNRPKLPKFHHHDDAHLGSLVLCQGFYQREAKGYPHRPNEVECNHKGWQGPDVGFGRRWNRLVATWGHASSADCQCRGLQDPAEYNGPGTPNNIHCSFVLEHTPKKSFSLLEVVWYPKGLQQTHKFLYCWDSYRAHSF